MRHGWQRHRFRRSRLRCRESAKPRHQSPEDPGRVEEVVRVSISHSSYPCYWSRSFLLSNGILADDCGKSPANEDGRTIRKRKCASPSSDWLSCGTDLSATYATVLSAAAAANLSDACRTVFHIHTAVRTGIHKQPDAGEPTMVATGSRQLFTDRRRIQCAIRQTGTIARS